MRLVIYPAKMSSSGAKALKAALNTIMVYPDRHYKPRHDDAVINWGNSRIPNWQVTMLNLPDAVRVAIRKDLTFATLQVAGVPTVGWFRSGLGIPQILKEGVVVFARKSLTGTQGQGIVVMKTPDDFVDASLYTLYEPGCKEYRVHVAFGKVINFQQKKKKRGMDVDKYIRSYDKGWIFARQGVVVPDSTQQVSIAAVAALGLDFGAVDILHNPKTGKDFVLEINTAPGLDSDNSIGCYANAFKQFAAKEHHV